MFFVFEGADGSGKTTHRNLLAQYLKSKEIPCVQLKDPPKNEPDIANEIELVINCAETRHFFTEFLLFSAARNELVKQIESYLSTGFVVLLDRYILSSVIYQLMANNASQKYYDISAAIEHIFPIPTHTFILLQKQPPTKDFQDEFFKNHIHDRKAHLINELYNGKYMDQEYINTTTLIHDNPIEHNQKIIQIVINRYLGL